jgi:hypothetical protein
MIIDKSKEINQLNKEMNNMLALEYSKPIYHERTKTTKTSPHGAAPPNFRGIWVWNHLHTL